MAKLELTAERIDLHDLLTKVSKGQLVEIYDNNNKMLFDNDEYFSINSLQEIYGMRPVEEISVVNNLMEVHLWY